MCTFLAFESVSGRGETANGSGPLLWLLPSAFISWAVRLCPAGHGPAQAVICCRDPPSVLTVDSTRDEKDQMRSKAQEASLFRGRGSVMRFWTFQRSDLAAQRGCKSLCAGLLFRGEADRSARLGGRPARLARRSSCTGGNGRSKRGLLVVALGRPLAGFASGMRC